jgi:hypothetical protein
MWLAYDAQFDAAIQSSYNISGTTILQSPLMSEKQLDDDNLGTFA